MSKGMMNTNRIRALLSAIIVMLLILALPGLASAQLLGGLPGPVKALVTGLAAPVLGTGPFVLNFELTPNLWAAPNGAQPAVLPDAATGTMVLYLYNGQTVLQFTLTNARPNTIYTIWTVFYPLAWPIVLPAGSIRPPLDPNYPNGPPGYYVEAGVVAPTASMNAHFTNGMGPDPGATFATPNPGNGYLPITLDYNILGNTYDDGPPVGNKVIVTQCVVDSPGPQSGPCPSPSNILRVTTTWLRKYIAQVLPEGRASYCANYNASDPASIYWQCIDPSTVDSQSGNGLPRVWRFPFDHFRLAGPPGGRTHRVIRGGQRGSRPPPGARPGPPPRKIPKLT